MDPEPLTFVIKMLLEGNEICPVLSDTIFNVNSVYVYNISHQLLSDKALMRSNSSLSSS